MEPGQNLRVYGYNDVQPSEHRPPRLPGSACILTTILARGFALIRTLFHRVGTITIPATVVATLVLATFTYPGGVSAAYSDLQDHTTLQQTMESARTDSSQLDTSLMNMSDRIALKEQWIDELISGRATLKSTTRRFMELNQSSDVTLKTIEAHFRGRTSEEKAARNVMAYVQIRLKFGAAPSNTPQRLQSEFHDQFGTTVAVN
jgi:hypothetical protein